MKTTLAHLVIPGWPEGPGPESITPARGYGFSDVQLRIIARDFVAPGNDGLNDNE
jgi:hypothetical protein